MYYFLTIFIGLLVSLMITVNGELSLYTGSYLATFLIHAIGLIVISIICVLRKENLFTRCGLSFLAYIGGTYGYFATVFSNLAYGKLSITCIIALSLFGQTLCSLLVDQCGLFSIPRRPIHVRAIPGLCFVLIGIVVMMSSSAFALLPVLFAFLSGVGVTVNRSANARLSGRTSYLVSTWYNYVSGLIISAGFLLVLGRMELTNVSTEGLLTHPWCLLGGVIGVCTVTLNNVAADKLSSLHMTLCLFLGQIFTGIALDIVVTHQLSTLNLVGGSFVAVGLSVHVWLENREIGNSVVS